MKHRLIVGATGNGKTLYLKKALAEVAKRSDARFFVYSPVDFSGWPRGARVYSDIDAFVVAIEEYVKSGARAAHVVIDEAGKLKTHYRDFSRFPAVLREITSQARHFGITAWISAQRPTMVHPDIREQCAEIVTFWLAGSRDRKLIQEDTGIEQYEGRPLQQEIGKLQKLECFIITPAERRILKAKIPV